MPLGKVIPCDFDSSPEQRTNFTNLFAVAAFVSRVRPEVIVNCAAHTAVDKAESEPELARFINATTVGIVAERTKKRRAAG
jgi:dTDP-4-dehydrorhamnose reductase